VLILRASLAIALFAALAASPVLASKTTHHTTPKAHTTAKAHATATTHGKRGNHKAAAKPRRLRGQQAIDPARVTEIQQALIREHYLNGDANGRWDETTKAAMQKFQADQGWQTKLMPDSRALKKLGLGPDYSNAINAKDSSFGAPPPASTIPPAVSSGFAEAAGVKQ
jgi:peptidoglycan hydrolase-like protein with peptidoglycan-binding domain